MNESIIKALSAKHLGPDELIDTLCQLEKGAPAEFYHDLIYVLSHLKFTPAAARRHWKKILDHRVKLTEACGYPIDVRVALLNYFVTLNRSIKNPKIIELQMFQKTEQSSITDELTGLSNYRNFLKVAKNEVSRAKRYKSELCLILFDTDDFKRFNDKYGHPTGNQALKRVAKSLAKGVREIDLVARYGGEEFGIILPETTKSGAITLANRLRSNVERIRVPKDRKRLKLTVSGGVASFPKDGKTLDALIEEADRALYRAKGGGKNMICAAFHETRQFSRVDSEVIGKLKIINRGSHVIKTKNLSRTGLLFNSDSYIPIGAVLGLDLNLPTAKRSIHVQAKVVRIEAKGPESFDIGARIEKMSAACKKALHDFVSAYE